MADQLTETQKEVEKLVQDVGDIIVMHAGAEIPDMSNYTPVGLVDVAGKLNELRKRMDKVEGFYKEILKSKLGDLSELRGEKYAIEYKPQVRETLNQSLARQTIEEKLGHDVLQSCLNVTEVPTMRFSKL